MEKRKEKQFLWAAALAEGQDIWNKYSAFLWEMGKSQGRMKNKTNQPEKTQQNKTKPPCLFRGLVSCLTQLQKYKSSFGYRSLAIEDLIIIYMESGQTSLHLFKWRNELVITILTKTCFTSVLLWWPGRRQGGKKEEARDSYPVTEQASSFKEERIQPRLDCSRGDAECKADPQLENALYKPDGIYSHQLASKKE